MFRKLGVRQFLIISCWLLVISFWLFASAGNESAFGEGGETKLPAYFQKYVDELITQLGVDDMTTREKATDQLIFLGPVVLPSIQPALNNQDAEVRLRAQQINIILHWKEAFTKRIDKFVAQVRKGSIEDNVFLQQSLQFLSGDESVSMLLELLKDSKQTLDSRRRVVNVLQSSGANLKPILPDLIQLWQNEKDQTIKFGLLQSFARVGRDERLTPILLKLLKEGDYNSKISAISVLGQLKEETALPELFNLLQTADDNTRNTVIYALNNFRTPQVFEEIFKAWKKETTPWLKAQTISILAQFQDKRLLPELAELSKTEKNPQILSNIAYALPQFRTDPLVSPISLTLLKTGDANIRAAALNVIRANNDRSVIPELINMLESESDFNSFTTLLDALQGITAQKFFPQQIPREMKDNILKFCKDWWTKNK